MILAVDPGTNQSAICVYGEDELSGYILDNLAALKMIQENNHLPLAIEMVACYGMPVGQEVFETVVWIGRFIQAHGGKHCRVFRKDIKLHVCNSPRATDASIRRALLDRFGFPGTKVNPGITYGFKKDMWAALAVAVTVDDKNMLELSP